MAFILLLIVEIVILYFLARKVTRKFFRILRNPYLFAILFFPGTFIHEMSHFLTALFLIVPVGKVDLFPKVDGDEIKLGSVAIAKTDPIRRTLIGIAPIIFGSIIIVLSIFYVYTKNLFSNPIILTLLGYLIFEVGNTMFSSKKDMEGVLPVFIAIFAIVVILYLLGIRISWEINVEIIQKIDIFIALPVFIDLLLILI